MGLLDNIKAKAQARRDSKGKTKYQNKTLTNVNNAKIEKLAAEQPGLMGDVGPTSTTSTTQDKPVVKKKTREERLAEMGVTEDVAGKGDKSTEYGGWGDIDTSAKSTDQDTPDVEVAASKSKASYKGGHSVVEDGYRRNISDQEHKQMENTKKKNAQTTSGKNKGADYTAGKLSAKETEKISEARRKAGWSFDEKTGKFTTPPQRM